MTRPRRPFIALATAAALAPIALGCSSADDEKVAETPRKAADAPRTTAAAGRASATAGPKRRRSAAFPAGIYSHTGSGMLSPVVKDHLERIYVPNSEADTVSVIDPAEAKVVHSFPVADLPHHITPSYDMKTFYVDNTGGNSLTPVDPTTAKPKGRPIPVEDPYNLYFTPGGRAAIVVAERLRRLDFRDPKTWRLQKSVASGCVGVDHMDFTADGRQAVASCEFDGTMLLIDLAERRVARRLKLDRPGAKPVDVRLSPDGKLFYVADEVANGVWKLDAKRFRTTGFIPTGRGTHGLYPSRDAGLLYATNRLGGTVSVIDFDTQKVSKTWRLPGGGSPDMGGVSADGKLLWLSGRYHSEVYAIDTRTGRLKARIPVGAGAHGMLVWPQPGRYSLGHTGNMR